jgi:hypothetical protein
MLMEAGQRAAQLVEDHLQAVAAVAELLAEERELSGEEVANIVEAARLKAAEGGGK